MPDAHPEGSSIRDVQITDDSGAHLSVTVTLTRESWARFVADWSPEMFGPNTLEGQLESWFRHNVIYPTLEGTDNDTPRTPESERGEEDIPF